MNVQRVAVVGSIVAVIAAVVASLMLLGSPAEQRLLRLDEQRVAELGQLGRAVLSRWEDERRLPDTAGELVDGRALTGLPTDPATHAPYEYRITGPRQFEVCATFDRPSRSEPVGDFWFHEAGHRCFKFDVTDRRSD
jgi:hypothetical protein